MEKEIKHLYFEVLAYLAQEGLGVETNLKSLCGQYVNKSREEENISDAFDAFSKSWNRVMAILSSLEKIGYIKYSTEYGDLQELYLVNGNFSSSITKEGLDYNYTHLLREATLRSLRNQKWYNFIIWGIALLSVATTIYTIEQNTDLNKKIKDLTEEVRQLKSWQHSMGVAHKTVNAILKKP